MCLLASCQMLLRPFRKGIVRAANKKLEAFGLLLKLIFWEVYTKLLSSLSVHNI